ncbi:copper resistance protein NlpE N-terminal domain-containing protein [Fluviicola taffensis]|uniref:copper resistance protein NlpE N-terminal domain-containing protein n=1 Tax=Fluviicola taffensis TaxID=191579 RepID=UPI0031380DF1
MINRINCLFVVTSSALILSGCIEHREDDNNRAKSNPVNKEEEKYIKDKEYKVFRIYEGEVPCEDCDGIQQRLVLKGDTVGIFRLTETYKNATEDGDATLVCSGQWQKGKLNSKNILTLSQGTLSDSVRRMEYELRSKEIVQLSLDKNRFKNGAEYHLKMIRKSK